MGEGASEAKLDKMGKELEALDAELGGLQPGQKFSAAEVRKQVKFQSLMRDYQIAMQSGKGGTNLARIEKLLEENAPQRFRAGRVQGIADVEPGFANYYYAVTGRRGADKLADYAKELSETKTKTPRR